MSTVGRDDQMVECGSNLRSELVSLFVVSVNIEECLGSDYVTVDKVGSAVLRRGGGSAVESRSRTALGGFW